MAQVRTGSRSIRHLASPEKLLERSNAAHRPVVLQQLPDCDAVHRLHPDHGSAGRVRVRADAVPREERALRARVTTLLMPGIMFLIADYIAVCRPRLDRHASGLIAPGLAAVFSACSSCASLHRVFRASSKSRAYVDGANPFPTFIPVVLPLSRPRSEATLGVITFLVSWNDYLWPLVVLLGTRRDIDYAPRSPGDPAGPIRVRLRQVDGRRRWCSASHCAAVVRDLAALRH